MSDSYAKALVELAEEKGRLEAVHADVDAVASLIKDNAKLRELLFNPVVEGDKKKKVLAKVSSEAGARGCRHGGPGQAPGAGGRGAPGKRRPRKERATACSALTPAATPAAPFIPQCPGFQKYTANFLSLLVEKDRLNLLSEICESFEEQYCELTDTQVRRHMG